MGLFQWILTDFDYLCVLTTIIRTMSEQNQNFDPKDLNQDGKVSVKERLLEAADKANEALSIAADAVKDGVGQVVDKVKDYQTLSPEEKKAKQDQWKEKASEVAGKAADTAKEFVDEVKESAEKLFSKKEA